jgi:uncharacterized membrane protein
VSTIEEMHRLSDRRVATIFALVLASGFCFALVWVRAWRTGSNDYGFLIWNLELAWIPFVIAIAFYDSWRRRRSRWLLLALGSLWLLFLPNAPYMVTDLVHLGQIAGAPLWYDGAMISAFAGAGLLLGLGSVFLVHSVALRTLGPRLGWVVLLPVLALCSAGVVLGRFARLNSWDALTRPGRLVQLLATHATDPLASRRALAATLGYAVFLVLAYVVLYAVSSLRPGLEHDRRL